MTTPAYISLWGQRLLSAGLVVALMLTLYQMPVGIGWLAPALIAYGVILWRYPAAWLVVLPALLPALDLMPWSGRLYLGEYDLVIMLTIAFGLWRGCLIEIPLLPRHMRWLLGALMLITGFATLRGWFGGLDLTMGDYTHYFGPFNALREAKGIFSALFLFLLLRLELTEKRQVATLFSTGMLCGLVMVCLIIIWERVFFTGPFDFAQVYRTTALFSSMHLGGASVDGFIAISFPFVAVIFLLTQNRYAHIAALLLFGFAMYAFLVTFSRTNYLALLAMLAVTLLGENQLRRGGGVLNTHTVRLLLAGTIVASMVALPIISGSYAQTRLSTLSTDLATRLNHWRDVFSAMDSSVGSILFGHGIGSFPRAFRVLEQSRGEHSAELHLYNEGGERFVHFTPSDPRGDLFLRQRMSLPDSGDGILTIKLRSHIEPPDKLLVEFCEMNILRAIPECDWTGIRMDAVPSGQWAEYSRPINLSKYGKSFLGLSRPVDILLLNRGLVGPVDIAEVSIVAKNGRQVLANTDFQAGMDHWLFNSGDHLKWHVKNLFLHVFFETGLVGLVIFGALLLMVLVRLIDRLAAGDRFSLILLVSLVGFIVLGIFDSLIDDPRIGMLFTFMLLLGLSPVTLHSTSNVYSILPWKQMFAVFTVMAVGLLLVAVVHTSLTHKRTPRELLLIALNNAEIDWPWLRVALKPKDMPEFPGPNQWSAQGVREGGFLAQKFDINGQPQTPVPNPFSPLLLSDYERSVSNVRELVAALRESGPGAIIVIEPGNYRLSGRRVSLGLEGEPQQPIVVSGREPGQVHIELDTVEGFYVDKPYWVFENLDIHGVCRSHSRCEHAFHVVGGADGTVIRNNSLIDFNAAVKVNGLPTSTGMLSPHKGLIAYNTIYNNSPRQTSNPVTTLNINNGDNWMVRNNFIADFFKAGGDRISYGAFMKGNSRNGVFERNLVVCYWRHPREGGLRIGLSLGGGGTGGQYCRDGNCETEHSNGTIRNNIIARCPDDVGIYLNRAAHTRVYNNLLAGTKGIDVRFPTASAEIFNNILEGGINERDGGTAISTNNLVAPACNWFMRWRSDCQLADWFADPLAGDFRLQNVDRILAMGREDGQLRTDFCNSSRNFQPDLGPIQYSSGASCLPSFTR